MKNICVQLVNVILNIIIVVSVIMKSRMFYRQTMGILIIITPTLGHHHHFPILMKNGQ